jgi:hypothetical protein
MELLSKEQILAANDLKYEDVPCPEWGEGVGVRVVVLSGTERDALEVDLDWKALNNIRAQVAARCVVGPDGKRLFTDADTAALGKKSGVALNRVYDACMKINKLRKQDVEGLEKNSDGAPGDSTSD